MKLTTLIAENEPRTLTNLNGLCAKRAELDVVAQVDCGAAAVSAIESFRPELLLLDAELPDMQGMDVLRTVRAPEERFTVLLTNRDWLQSNRVHSDSLGYLAKPVRRRHFDELIDVAIARQSIVPPGHSQARDWLRRQRRHAQWLAASLGSSANAPTAFISWMHTRSTTSRSMATT